MHPYAKHLLAVVGLECYRIFRRDFLGKRDHFAAPTDEPTPEAPRVVEICPRCGRELDRHQGGKPCP